MTDKQPKIIVYQDWQGFESLKPEWDALLRASDADCLFLTWDWIDCWRRSRPIPPSPLIITLWHDNELQGIAPLYRARLRLLGTINYAALRLLGDEGVGSEYGNFIVRKDHHPSLRQALWQYVRDHCDWDLIYLPNIAAFSGSGKDQLDAVANTDNLAWRTRIRGFAAISLSPASVLDKLPKGLKQTIRTCRNKAHQTGEAVFASCTSQEQLQSELTTLFELHNRRRQNAGEHGSFERRPELQTFYRLYAPTALNQGTLRLFSLTINGATVAMQIGYLYDNRFMALQEGFDTDSELKGAGHLLRHHVIRHCEQQGAEEYDFLGEYTAHKKRWRARFREGRDLLIWRRTLRNLPIHVLAFWPGGRYLKWLNQVPSKTR